MRTAPRPVAFALVAYAFGVTMLGTTLPSPLYPLYQQRYGFTALLTTVVYAVYAAGVLAALLLFGRASDVVGRRRVLLAGLVASGLSALVFLADAGLHAGLPALFAGRVLSGLSAGALTATATVTLIELAPPRRRGAAALLATAVNMLGLGCGPLLAGILAQYLPYPLLLPYVVDLLLLAPALLALRLVPETASGAHSTASAQERVRLPKPERPSVPAEARAVFAPAAVATFAAFAVFGLLTAIAPGFLATLLHEHSRALAGAVVFSMFAGSALGQVGLARLRKRVALPVGCAILIAGLGLIAAALSLSSAAGSAPGGSAPGSGAGHGLALGLLVAGAVVVGAGQGVSFRAGMAAITAASPAERRTGTVASLFVTAYVAISVPVILVGVAATVWGLRAAALWFTAAAAALAAAALVAVLRLDRLSVDADSPDTPTVGARPTFSERRTLAASGRGRRGGPASAEHRVDGGR